MTARQIKDFELPPLADQCTLFLWRLTNMQELAIEVMHEWGFKLYGEIVWVKLKKDGTPRTGMGMMIRGAHETCLIGTRGGLVKPLATRHGVIQAPWRGHSRKPEELFDLIEEVWAGPYTELFARRQREGWRCLGNELLSDGK